MYAEDKLCKALFKMSVQNNFIISIILYKKNVALCLSEVGAQSLATKGRLCSCYAMQTEKHTAFCWPTLYSWVHFSYIHQS